MADTLVDANADSALNHGTGLWGPYWINTTTSVALFINFNDDIYFTRTTDSGGSWTETIIQSGTTTNIACWFDKETPGDSGDIVNVAWLDSTDGELKYVTLDVSDGSLGTIRTVATGLTISVPSLQYNNRIALTKTVSGNLIAACSTQSEVEAYKSDDLFATSATNISDVYESGTQEDHLLLFPADTGDNNDACGIFWDRSASEISIKMYDDSADNWTETSIGSSMTAHFIYMNMDASVRHSDNHILLAAHSEHDSFGDDLLTWDLTVNSIATPTITAKTNVITNQSEAAQVAVLINQQNDDVYVAYLKGNFIWESASDVVFLKSTDDMATWGSEESYSEASSDDLRLVHGGRTVGNDGGRIQWMWYNDDTTDIWVNLVNDIDITAVGGAGWANKAMGVVPGKVQGLAVASISKVQGT